MNFGGIKKVRGIELINKVEKRFATIIAELDEGANDCQCERTNIQDQITSLNQRDDLLDSSIKKANVIANNLRTLISE